MALALVLLTGAGLLVRTFVELVNVDLGIDPTNVVTMRLRLPDYKYASALEQAVFYRELMQKIENLPGVKTAGAEGGGANVFSSRKASPRRRPDRNRLRATKS